MKDPDLPPLDPSLARLLRSEKARPGPASTDLEAVWGQLADRLPAGPGPSGGAPPAGGAPVAEPLVGDAPRPAATVRPSAPGASTFTLVGSRAVAALVVTFAAGGLTGAFAVASFGGGGPNVTASLGAPESPPERPPSRGADRDRAGANPNGAGATPGGANPSGDGANPSGANPAGDGANPGAGSGSLPSSEAHGAAAIAASPAVGSGSARVSGLAPSASASAKPASSAARRDVDLAAERSLLDEARAALARGEGQRCLSALARHQSEYPGGRLSVEREVLTIQALVVSGRRDEAVRRAKDFRAAHPNSLLWPAVEASVGPIP